MDSIKHKLDEFTKVAAGEISEIARARIEGIKADRWTKLNQAKEEIYAQVESYKRRRIQEIQAREGLRVSACLLESRKRLFSYRQNSAQTVLGLVTDKIQQFTGQEAYPIHLKTLLHRALALLEEDHAIIILLRSQDMDLKAALEAELSGRPYSFQAGTFTLGGLVVICDSQSLRIDLSFDTALESAMDHFAEIFGMDLT